MALAAAVVGVAAPATARVVAAPATTPAPGPGRLVVACLAPSDLRPEVDPLTGEVRRRSQASDLTAADAAALEHARRAADAWDGRLVAVAAGSASVEGALRRGRGPRGRRSGGCPGARERARARAPLRSGSRPATARPARVLDGPELVGDQIGLARRLAAVIARLGPPDLVVCGDRSALGGTGALPALLAHHLGCRLRPWGWCRLQVDEARP